MDLREFDRREREIFLIGFRVGAIAAKELLDPKGQLDSLFDSELLTEKFQEQLFKDISE